MKRRAAVLGSVLGLSLGCGGLWQEVLAETFSEHQVDLEERVPEGDPRRADVERILEDGFAAAWEGQVGMGALLSFSVAFDDVIEDGRIDEGDLVWLRERAAPFELELTEERRADLVAMKQAADARIRAERGLLWAEAPAAASLADWELPGDLEAALNAAGWPVDNCQEAVEGPVRTVSCLGMRDDRVAAATVQRSDTETVLDVLVQDGAAAARLRDAVVPPGQLLAELDPERVRAVLVEQGWEIERFDAGREGRLVTLSVLAAGASRSAAVTATLQPGGRGRQQRDLAAAVASVLEGQSVLTVLVQDEAAAAELEGVLRPGD